MNINEIKVNMGATILDEACLFPATIVGKDEKKNLFYLQMDVIRRRSEAEDDYTVEKNPDSLIYTVVWNKKKSGWHTYKSHYLVQPGKRIYNAYRGYYINKMRNN